MRPRIREIMVVSRASVGSRYVFALFLFLCFGIEATSAAPQDHFVTTWKTDNPGTSSPTSIRVPMVGGPYDVDWDNDGVFDQLGLFGSVSHNYGNIGVNTIRIRGIFDAIRFANSGDKKKVLTIDQWGTNSWVSMNAAFSGAWYLTIPAVDTPDFSLVTDMQSMFLNATSANPDTSSWDTSAVTTMRSMFYGATSADPDTSGWDTSAVTTMRTMFYSATSANPDTSGWDTQLVINMLGMFMSAHSANPDTSSWNTAAVTNMSSMFNRATSANPDTSSWNTANVTDMTYMFYQAITFNRAIGNWDVSSLTDANGMFEGATLSSENYDNLLIGWDAQALKPSVSFHGGNSVYCSAAATLARTNMLGADSWLITDGGPLCPVTPAVPIIAPDLIPETDTGVSNTDDLTTDSTPRFYANCSATGNTITLFTDNPVSNLPVGRHLCKSAGLEIINVNKALSPGLHNISYTDRIVRQESGHSPILLITLDPPLPTDDFVTTWNTNAPGNSNSSSIEFHVDGDPYDIDWDNDGIFDDFGLTGPVIHDFGVPGIYTIRIRSGHASFHIGYDHESEKIISIDQWGTMLWKSLHTAFYNAKNLEIPAVDIPDFSAVTSTLQMFLGAILANPDTSMWDTSKVTSMQQMFWGARSAIPDTSNWDTSAVTNMNSMFWGAALANPDVSSWDVSALMSASGMFSGIALATENYERLLIGWSAQALKSNVVFSGGNSIYCSAAAVAARANMVANNSWDITDWGLACPPSDPVAAPDLSPASDTGVSDSDDITTNITPAFFVMCSVTENTISLYTDNPAANTLVGTHICTASGTARIFATTPLTVGLHNISYTDKKVTAESGPSPSLVITIKPQGPVDDFVTTWKTDNPGSSSATSITVPMVGGPFDVDWDNDGNFDETGLSGNVTHDFGGVGTYTIRIRGIYNTISFRTAGDKEKILSLDQWGTNTWKSMNSAFSRATNLVVPAIDTPNFSAITNMSFMFYEASSVNPDVSSWDTSSVINMSFMFSQATSANPNVSSWDTSSVTDMSYMFSQATSANPDVSGWDTSSVINMSSMFAGNSTFEQAIGSWNITSLRDARSMFHDTVLSPNNYDNLLIGWNAQTLQPNVSFSAGNSNYCSAAAVAARANMLANDSWNITDRGLACSPPDPVVTPDLNSASDNGVSDSDDITTNITPAFIVMCSITGNTISLYTDNPTANTLVGTHICTASGIALVFATTPLAVGVHNISYTDKILSAESGPSPSLAITIEPQGSADDFVTTWKTDNPGSSSATSITVPLKDGPYDVDWNNDEIFDEFGLTGEVTHDFGSIGTYTIRIRGRYDAIGFDGFGDHRKILSLDQWGSNVWKSMSNGFSGASNLIVSATDTPNFSSTTRLDGIFSQAISANPNTSDWDISAVTDMRSMFSGASSANPDTSGWDTAAVTDMVALFRSATQANPDTSGWDTSSVNNMWGMFDSATSANPDTSGWDTSSVRDMERMFLGAKLANPDVSGWDTSLVAVMRYMFWSATLANPNVSDWDTSNVYSMRGMFSNATTFDQDIGSWDVTSLQFGNNMFAGIALSTANYDSLLIGWSTQALKTSVHFSGGNSKYCSAAAVTAKANMIAAYGWTITDGGQGCPSSPTTPATAPDLIAATDTGIYDSDNITANDSPQFEVVCSMINNSITLYTDRPTANTAIGTHACTSVGVETASATAVLVDGVHNITYIDQYIGERSGHSPSLVVTIDTVAAGAGSLSAPGSPINDTNADITGSCGVEAANDTVVLTTSATNGFSTLYNTPIILDGTGSFSIIDPNWSEGTFTVYFECSDVAGNTATLGPFGPILIDLSCSGVDTIVTGDFLAGMHLCAGTSSLVTSGVVNIETGAVVYFQSPKITLNPDFNVKEGASLITSSVVGPVAPLLLGPTEIRASIGDIVVFSESHVCEDLEDGVLAIVPLDTGVLVVSDKTEVFTLSCTNSDGKTTQKNVMVIRE